MQPLDEPLTRLAPPVFEPMEVCAELASPFESVPVASRPLQRRPCGNDLLFTAKHTKTTNRF
jgi:hypothetical protein